MIEGQPVSESVAIRLVSAPILDDWAMVRPPGYAAAGVQDLSGGLRRWRLWTRMALEDIRQRYRRSMLGPLWLSLSMLIMIGSMGVVYAQIFKVSVHNYLPFLAYGLLFWTLLGDIVREGCQCFTQYEGILRQIKLPLSTHVYRMIARHFLVFGHNLVGCVLVAVAVGGVPGPAAFLAIPGLFLWAINAVWVTLLLGMTSTRFRDMPPLIASLLQILFFVSPIMWDPATLNGRFSFVTFNPVYQFIELVRAPLQGQAPPLQSWLLVGAMTLVGWGITFPFFARFRGRITYWL